LIYAANNGNKEIVQLLLHAKANSDIKNNYGNTALIKAASWRHEEIVQLLLDANAEIDIKNNDNKSALDIAHAKGFHDIAEIIKNEPRRRRELVQKEVSEHLIPDLADLFAEYFVFYPKTLK